MNPKTEPGPERTGLKPGASFFIATAGGLGYLPKAPGTFGSLAGVLITWLTFLPFLVIVPPLFLLSKEYATRLELGLLLYQSVCIAVVALGGVRAAGNVAAYCGQKDPQFVVIDEVSGQQLTLVVGLAGVDWKYLLLGFILFRVFDIWKPFPARQAEALPGGWGIMADDWIAAVYAALGLWLARAAGL